MNFAVSQDTFSGPLGVLLELLDSKELQISDVALARITDDYLQYLERESVPHDELADFLLIASRLIYLKSRELMPSLVLEEEEEGVSLEEQLRLYRLFINAAQRLEGFYTSNRHGHVPMFVRTQKIKRQTGFLPPAHLLSTDLQGAFDSLLKRLEPFFALQEASIARVKSVEERIEELQSAIRTRATMTFREVARGARSRADLVVSFLALLELVRRQVVRAKQTAEHDIVIEQV